ncbi:MAG TPA: hypothetical protein VIY29_07720 [Ktedonobacteraceae bacterium]
MSEHHGQRQRRCDRVEGMVDRDARRVHQSLYSCDECSAVLRKTHDYVAYENLCWTCWRRHQSRGVVPLMASH